MKFSLKAHLLLPILFAKNARLFLALACCILLPYSAEARANTGIKLAAGYPLGPANMPSQSNSSTSSIDAGSKSLPSSTKTVPIITPSTEDLPLKEKALGSVSATGASSTEAANKTIERKLGIIEYDISLAPIATQPGLSVVQSMNEALMNNPRAAAIRAQFGISRTNYAAATQGPNPIMFMDRGLYAEQVLRLGPTLPIEPPWKLAFRMLATKRLVDQTKIDLLASLWALRADVRRTYVEVVVAQETLKTLTELYDLSSKLLAVAEKRFHAGDVPELDLLKARLANSQNDVEMGVGKNRVLRSFQQLNVIMGKTVDEPVNVPGLPGFTGKSSQFNLRGLKSDILPDFDRPIPSLSYFLELAFNNRLELKSLTQQLRVNKANLLNAYGNVIPNAMLTFGKSSAGNPTFGPKLTAVFFTLNAPVPFSDWNQGDIYRYKATGRQLHYQVGAQRNEIMSEVTSAYQNLIAQREKIRSYQNHVLADSYEVARLARRSYEVGQSDITSTLQAQQANVQIRSQYLDAVMSYGQAFTDLEEACGLPLQ